MQVSGLLCCSGCFFVTLVFVFVMVCVAQRELWAAGEEKRFRRHTALSRNQQKQEDRQRLHILSMEVYNMSPVKLL